VANAQVPDWDSVVVIVNSTQYGGSGGQIATTSISGSDWPFIAIHEYGHSAFGLGDENEYYAGLAVAATDNCPGSLPIGVQVFSDEGDTAPTGEGNFSPDAKDIAPGHAASATGTQWRRRRSSVSDCHERNRHNW
jgi:hypothetical protein